MAPKKTIRENSIDLAIAEDNKKAKKRREQGIKEAADSVLREYEERRKDILIFNSGGPNAMKGDISTLKKIRKTMLPTIFFMDLCKFSKVVSFVFPHQNSIAVKAGTVAFLLFVNAGLDKYVQVALCQDQAPEEFQVEHK